MVIYGKYIALYGIAAMAKNVYGKSYDSML